MELKEGMYVRTKKGNIAKIDRKVDDITNYYFGCFECDNYINVNGDEFISEYEITKASHNIIDLIEVGDYVNGYKVAYTMETLLGFEDGQDGDWYMSNESIKLIVTKEQFESMSYKVGD